MSQHANGPPGWPIADAMAAFVGRPVAVELPPTSPSERLCSCAGPRRAGLTSNGVRMTDADTLRMLEDAARAAAHIRCQARARLARPGTGLSTARAGGRWRNKAGSAFWWRKTMAGLGWNSMRPPRLRRCLAQRARRSRSWRRGSWCRSCWRSCPKSDERDDATRDVISGDEDRLRRRSRPDRGAGVRGDRRAGAAGTAKAIG